MSLTFMPSGLLIKTASPSENWLCKSEHIRRHESVRKMVVTDLCNLISEPASFFCFFSLSSASYKRGITQTLAQASGIIGSDCRSCLLQGFSYTLVQIFLYTKKWRHRKINVYNIYIYYEPSIIIIVKLY